MVNIMKFKSNSVSEMSDKLIENWAFPSLFYMPLVLINGRGYSLSQNHSIVKLVQRLFNQNTSCLVTNL